MSSIFTKNFHLCFSKIKCLPTSLSTPLTLEDNEEHHLHQNDVLITKTFDSVYDLDLSLSSSSAATSTTTDTSSTTSAADSPPDFSTTFASHRFFVSSPGLSNSILDYSLSSSPQPDPNPDPQQLGVPIRKYSPDPFSDFRKSMQEMIEAREKLFGRSINDWEYLHELLQSYLSLNPKHTHKFIIGAFADLLVSLMDSSDND